jgi:hypothetical protein
VATSNTSPGQTVTLQNTGTGALGVTGVTTAPPFAVTQNCKGASLAPGQSCSETVTYTPTTLTTSSGTVTFATTGGTATDSVTGTGGTAQVSTASSLSFGSVNVGSPSSPQDLLISNTGTAPLNVSVTGSPDIVATHNCSQVAAGSSCTEQVTETPYGQGTNTGYMFVNSEAGSKHIFTSVIGLHASDYVNPTSLIYGSTSVGSSSAPQTVNLYSNGNADVQVQSVNVTFGPFSIVSNTCSGTLVAGTHCAVQVIFTPTTKSGHPGGLVIKTNVDSNTITLAGTGA